MGILHRTGSASHATLSTVARSRSARRCRSAGLDRHAQDRRLRRLSRTIGHKFDARRGDEHSACTRAAHIATSYRRRRPPDVRLRQATVRRSTPESTRTSSRTSSFCFPSAGLTMQSLIDEAILDIPHSSRQRVRARPARRRDRNDGLLSHDRPPRLGERRRLHRAHARLTKTADHAHLRRHRARCTRFASRAIRTTPTSSRARGGRESSAGSGAEEVELVAGLGHPAVPSDRRPETSIAFSVFVRYSDVGGQTSDFYVAQYARPTQRRRAGRAVRHRDARTLRCRSSASRRTFATIGTIARSVLNGPDTTGMGFWSINPYVGCAFGCAYCYARYAHRWVLDRHADGESRARRPAAARDRLAPWLAFERRIFVKQNAADVLRKALRHGSEKHLALLARRDDRHRHGDRSVSAGRASISRHAIGARGARRSSGAFRSASSRRVRSSRATSMC